MAATSLWHIEGRLKDLISYVENPEKTVPNKEMQDFFDVFSYVKNPQKTDNGEFVSAINCLKETALQQMILTKKQYQKTGGYIAWHGYQSFKPDEVTPEQCHEIGLKLAREMWGDKYQIIVVTHLDRGHLHNHFCFNSVSYLDGSKYNYSKSEQKRLRETSDRLCREYGLSVIENPKKAPSRPLYLDEKSGKPTRYNVYLEDLAEAISGSRDIPHMMKYLIDKGYEVDFSGGHWKMKLPQYKHFTRLDTLDERLTPDFIRSHLGTRARYGNYKAKISYSPHMPEEYKKAWKPHQKTRGILALYYYWCYQLGIFPKGTDYKPTSPLMKEELRKLDEITTVHTVNAIHRSKENNSGTEVSHPAFGFILEVEPGVVYYHVGDTCLFGDMRLYRELYHPTVMTVGISSFKAPYPPCEMPAREAAYAVSYVGPDVVIPTHYPESSHVPEEFRKHMETLAPQVKIQGKIGKTFLYIPSCVMEDE